MLRVILLFLLVAPALWGCVSLDEYGALREAYNKLDAERQTSKQAVQTAQNNVAKLSGELKRVQQELKDLEAKFQKTSQEMTALSLQLEATKRVLVEKEKETYQPKPAKPPRGKKP